MPSLRNLGHRAKARCIRIKHTSPITITSTEPPRSCDDINTKLSESIIITEVELPATTPRASLDSTTSSTSTLVELTFSGPTPSNEHDSCILSPGEEEEVSNDDITPQKVDCTELPASEAAKRIPKSCHKSSITNPSAAVKKTLFWSDNYHIIGPSANERDLLTIHEIIRDDSELGFTSEDSALWKLNKSIHREVNAEEIVCTGYCGAQKIRFLREEEFKREEMREEGAYGSWKEKAEERKKKWAEQVRECVIWEEDEKEGEVMVCRDDESDESDEEED